MTKVKICGITRLEDAERAIEHGAWALGFILWEPSKRYVNPAVAAGIIRAVRRKVETVGVFVNQPLDEIADRVDILGLTHVQLHGDEGPSFCSAVAQRTGAKVIKAARIGHAADLRDLERFHTDFHLLDTAKAGQYGGTGATWDWKLAANRRNKIPLILSGGLTADNVADGIAAVKPYAVDVASGVEAAPGVKDPEKLEAFFAAVRAGARAHVTAIEHRFGPYGGQYVPETLVPALVELEAAWLAARDDPTYQAELNALLNDYVGRPSPLYLAQRVSDQVGHAGLPQARGPQPHRRAQDQQRARPGAAGQAHGQDADHRRDRRGLARRRDRHRLRAARPGLLRLHGHRGHAPPGAQRPADGPARHDGRPGRRRRAHAQGGGQRRDPRLGRQRRHDALRDRLLRRPRAVPGARARPAADHRRRGARADPGEDRRAARAA